MKKIRESEVHYRQLFNLLPYGGEIINTKGIIINCSSSTSRMLGYESDEIIGKHITNFVDAETIKIFKKNFPKILKGESFYSEVCMIHKNGNKINILRATQPIFNADKKVESMLALNIDITARKKAEKEIAQLSTAVTQSPSVIAITDLKGNLEYVNPKFTELTGYTFEEAKGKNPRILKYDGLPDEVYEELWKTISSGKIWHGEFHNKKKNGELFWESASVSPILNKEGKIINYIKVAEDITKRKQAEDNLKKKMQELEIFNTATVNRELKIIELKKEINKLLEKSGEKPLYKIVT